ncbi:flagellar filament capping protein FliD [Mucispirillum schaedleri]|uniref:flagellar filament capping protein FliD n=1 Tax=Mucispirillum schaedleri TaxID=248039 RepID=UPI001F55BCC0|nr:flagellar filament capping protein FliD [Mucispirillum schaedleri]
MEGLRVSGLISGMDTDSIVEAYMNSAKAPIVKLNQQIDELTYEKTTYNNFITMITDIKNSMLSLKMESTFKSKTTTSSVETVASAIASITTPPGTYTLKVDQVAEPAYATSIYTNKVLSQTGAGIKSFSPSFSPYDQLEGTHTVNVYTDKNNLWVAKDTFKGNSNDKYSVNYSDTSKNGLFDSKGNTTAKIKGDFEFVYTFNGETKSFSINMDYSVNTSINKIAADLDTEINAKLDALHGNNSQQTMKVTVQYDEDTGGFSFAFYDVDTQNEIEVLGMVDPKQDSSQPNTAATDLINNMGLNATYKSQSTKEITNYLVSTSSENLGIKLNSTDKGGFFAPGKIEFEDGKGPTKGTFKIYQDASAVCRPETYTTFYGDTFDKIANANPAIDRDEIDKWLDTKIGSKTTAGNTFFDDGTVFKDLNGVFYINGTKIEIEDYTKYTPNELMAKINGSGAGVTMSYDYEKNIFQISNNKGGAVELTMGNDTDTSSFFSVFKVGINSGATYVRGQNKGSLDTSAVISKLDPSFTYPIKSGTFTINGVSIYVDTSKDSINEVISKVNKSGAGVTMTYDSTTDKFSLTSTNEERIKVGGPNDTSSFLLSTGLLYMQTQETTIGTEGKDAVFTMNGVKYTRENNEVNDVVPGMSFTINTTGTTVFNVKIDTDKAVTALAEFAAKYNKLINALNPTEISYKDELREKYSEPLTDEKKESMSEDEIKKYQENYEKIQYHDLLIRSSELRTLKTNIRANLTKTINSDNSKFKSITQVGINIAGSSTRDTTITKLGLLFDVSTDPEKLAEYIKEQSNFVSILSENPDDVFYFFTDSETVYEKDEKGKETSKIVSVGWARVYSDYLDKTVNSTSALYKKTATNGTIESEISLLKNQIESQTTRVEMYLERLYSQFAAMEERISTLQQSASYLTNLSTNNASK